MNKANRFPRILGPGFLLLGLLDLSGCGQATVTPPAATAPAAPSGLVVVHPERKILRRVVEQPGTMQAQEETLLYSRVPGFVRKLRPEVDIGYKIHGPKFDASGKEIEPGEVLAELAVPELEEDTRQKEAMVRQRQAEVDQAEKALAAAEATISVSQAMLIESQANLERWQSESKRMAGLATSGVVDSSSRDEAMNQSRGAAGKVASAKASIVKARADRDRASSDVLASKTRVEVARADAKHAEVMLGYAKIRAPFDGIVTLRNHVNTGDLVQPAATATDALFRVARIDPIRVVISVPEGEAELVQTQSDVKLVVQALPDANLSGKVTRTSWALDPGARTLRAEVELPNKNGLLRPGMYVYAQISSEMAEAWTLPAAAVMRQADGMACFVIEDGKAIRTGVQIGRSDGQAVAVLKKRSPGTTGAWIDWTGKEVVAARASGLTDGQEVKEISEAKK